MQFMTPIVLVLPIAVAVAVTRNQRNRRKLGSATIRVEIDSTGARRSLADGREEAVDWEDVTVVEVFTIKHGPHGESGGAVVLYGDHERGCIIPLDRVEESGLLHEIYRLPRFDLRRVVEAIQGSDRLERAAVADPRQFLKPRPFHVTTVCWRRDDGQSGGVDQ